MDNSIYYKRCREVIRGYIDDLKIESADARIDGNYSMAMDYLFLDKNDDSNRKLREEIILIIDYRYYIKVRDAILIIRNATEEDYNRNLFVGYSVNCYSKEELIDITTYLFNCLDKFIFDGYRLL